MPAVIAVLTGDIVGSTRLSQGQLEQALAQIRQTAADFAEWSDPEQDPRFTRYRGDGWQFYLLWPKLAVRAAVVIQAHLLSKSVESRISIGIGSAASLGTTDLGDAAGAAFERSGRGLDKMEGTSRLSIVGEGIAPQDGMITDLLAERMARWTAAQAEASARMLMFSTPTFQELGDEFGISPQAVNDRLRAAGYHTIRSVLNRWETISGRGWEQDP